MTRIVQIIGLILMIAFFASIIYLNPKSVNPVNTEAVKPIVANLPAKPIVVEYKEPKLAGLGDVVAVDPIAAQQTGLTLTPLEWKASSEVPLYDTYDGFLHVGEFAEVEPGNFIGYMPTTTTTGTSSITINPYLMNAVDIKQFNGMKQVNAIGKQYIDIFKDNQEIVYVTTTQQKYEALKQKNSVKPSLDLLK